MDIKLKDIKKFKTDTLELSDYVLRWIKFNLSKLLNNLFIYYNNA